MRHSPSRIYTNVHIGWRGSAVNKSLWSRHQEGPAPGPPGRRSSSAPASYLRAGTEPHPADGGSPPRLAGPALASCPAAWASAGKAARRSVVLPYRRDMPARNRPTPEDTTTARRVLLDGLARDADISELVSELAPLHPRDNNTFPGEVFLHLAADALDWCRASRADPLPLEGLRERFLPECT